MIDYNSAFLFETLNLLVFLGQEKSEFWSLLGGEAAYIKDRETKSAGREDFAPRLFHGSNASGIFKSKFMVLASEPIYLIT